MLSNDQKRELIDQFSNIPGGYVYLGAASTQVCFPLKAGGELRVMWVDDDVCEEGKDFFIDLYGGELPGITGPTIKTGEQD